MNFNYLEILALALQIYVTRSGSFTTYLGGAHVKVTVLELNDAPPIGHLSWQQILVLAVGIATGSGSFTVRLGADEYQITLAPA